MYAIPTVIAAGAIARAVMIPTVECTSGFDTSECTDNTVMKWFIALVGIAFALVVLGATRLVGWVMRSRAVRLPTRDG